MINGCDLSHHNAIPSTFAPWAFACVRVSFGRGADGAPELDERAELHAARMRATRFDCQGIAYHWLNMGGAREQAELLLSREADVGGGAWGLAIDVEDLPEEPFAKAPYARRLLEALNLIGARDPRRVLVYGSGSYLAGMYQDAPITMREVEARALLWLADWSAPYTIPEPWTRITLLQDHGAPPGGIDHDVFPGSAEELRAVLGLAEGPVLPSAHGLLARGSIGPEVRELQQRLVKVGATIKIDGVFGPLTEGAVRAFQLDRGLDVDGIAGGDTWTALDG